MPGRQWRNFDASSDSALFGRITPKLLESFWEQTSTCILTWPVQRCSIIPHFARFILSVQTQWAVKINIINMSTGSAKLVGCVGANGLLIYKYIIILQDFTCLPISYTHISLFEFNQILFSSSKCDASSHDIFFSTKVNRGVFLHPCPMVFSACKTQGSFDWAKPTCPKKECNWANWVYNW